MIISNDFDSIKSAISHLDDEAESIKKKNLKNCLEITFSKMI